MMKFRKALRAGATLVVALAIAAPWAGPALAQGTVPCEGQTIRDPTVAGILNACTGTVQYGPFACPLGILATGPNLDPSALGLAPPGMTTGLIFSATGCTRPGIPRTTVCFPGTGRIRYYDTTLRRWVTITRTFSRDGQTCFTGRITGNFGLFSP